MTKKNLARFLIISQLFTPFTLLAADSDPRYALEKIIEFYTSPWAQIPAAHAKYFCMRDELTISQIENENIVAIKNAILNKDFAVLEAAGLKTVSNLPKHWAEKRSFDGISELAPVGERASSLKMYLSEFSEIADLDLKIIDYFIQPEMRKKQTAEFDSVVLSVRMDLRGKNSSHKLRNDRATLRMAMEKQNQKWVISEASVVKATSLVQSREPAFTEMTKVAGLDKSQIYRRTEAIRRGGYAMSITDINGDGIQDIFVGMKGGAELWLGRNDGTFVKQKDHPFKNEQFTKTAVFFDMDNSGNQSALINRYQLPDTKEFTTPDSGILNHPKTDVVIYKNENGTYQVTEVKGDKAQREPMPAAIADFNNDGYLDFYIGYPGTQDFSFLGNSKPKPLSEVQGLYMNDRHGKYMDFSEKAFAFENKGIFEGRLFPHSSIALDFRQRGIQDLLVAEDRGHLSPLFENDGKGFFHESAEKIGIINHGYSMSLAAGDINNDGKAEIAITNVHLTEFDRLTSACERHFAVDPKRFPSQLAKGLMLFQDQGNGQYKDISRDAFPDFEGDATAGITFLDYNNDGYQDLYVVNGLWSGTKAGQDLGSFFSSVLAGAGDLRYALRPNDQMHFMDILSGFQGKIENYMNASSIVEGKERPSLGGYQRNRLYRNNGNGTFTEVGFLEGVDSIADGYIAGRVNLQQDGKMDLVLRNADPGTDEYQFPVVQVYKNNFKTKRKSAILSFHGVNSNRDGFGLFAKAYFGKSVQVQHLVANSGSLQEQRVLHFGYGKHAMMDKLEIYWPSGTVQTMRNLKPGYHQITEPLKGPKFTRKLKKEQEIAKR
jgi:hypothetical protein